MKKIAWNEDWIYRKQDGEQRKVILPHDAMIEEEEILMRQAAAQVRFFPAVSILMRSVLLQRQGNIWNFISREFTAMQKF